MKPTYNILSFDIGANLGWCHGIVDLRNGLEFTVSDHGVVSMQNLLKTRAHTFSSAYDNKSIKLFLYEQTVTELINRRKFDAYVTEDVFMNPRLPTAYEMLVLYRGVVERCVLSQKNCPLVRVAATSAKLAVSGTGGADKDQVQLAVLNHPDINFRRPTNVLSEHEADAIANGFAYAKGLTSFQFDGVS